MQYATESRSLVSDIKANFKKRISKMAPGTIIVIVLIIALVSAVGYIVYLKRKSEPYTRERYAFAALIATVNLVGLGVATVLGKTPQSVVGELRTTLFGSHKSDSQPLGFSDQLLILIFIAFVIYLIHRNFSNWKGSLSIEDKMRLDIHEQRAWVVEGFLEMLRIIRREGPHTLYTVLPTLFGTPVPPPSETLSWAENARELVELRWRDYLFPLDGWHDMQSAWFGSNKKTGAQVGLLCVHTAPTDARLTQFSEYVERLFSSEVRNIELLVATQDNSTTGIKRVGNTEFRLENETSLLDELVDFSDYFREIERRATKETLPDSNLTIQDVYVPPLTLHHDMEAQRAVEGSGEDLNDLLSRWLAEHSQRHIALLGEYGQGKSTAALMFTYRQIQHAIENNKRIPLLIELRGASPSTLLPIQLLGAWCSAYRIEPRSLMKLIMAGRAIVIFEGFDEMAEAGDVEARRNHFGALWKGFAYPRNKMIITGRPNFFLDEKELQAALGIERASGAAPHCEAFYLKFFDVGQIAASLSFSEQSTREQIVALAANDSRFFDIVSRPSLLYIVAILWKSAGLSQRPNLNSAGVMELFTLHSYRRQEQKSASGKEFMRLSPNEREYFMTGIASYMAARNLPNQIFRDQFHDAVLKLYDLIPENINLKRLGTQTGPIRPLKERLAGRKDPIIEIETDVRTYGLLVVDYGKTGALRFAHKSFFEFIFARLVADRLLGLEKELCAAIVAATNASVQVIAEMPVSLGFLGEIIGSQSRVDQDPGRVMQSIFDAIVFRNKIRTSPFIVKFLSLEFSAPENVYARIFHFYARPSILIFSLGFLCFLFFYKIDLGDLIEFGSLSLLPTMIVRFEVPLFVLFMFAALINFALELSGIGRAIALWYLVISQMGWSEEEIEKVYGRRAVQAIHYTSLRLYRALAVRDMPKSLRKYLGAK
ncbi:NACHT domain-containing protein [Paraburkholderia sp. 35.1]|uniref:NACHT domain-containing protein n=1 Tax=Paraburkholderia sp. 35.1 TaxID=2991058 RepID=UPI003D255FAF